MAKTYYCANCLNSFRTDGTTCPNLACGQDRPEGGWGRLLGEGDLLDRRYRVRQRLAVGGAGITYRAREIDDDGDETGPELAIKVLFQRGDGTWLRRLANEARVLQELAHPNIVQSRGFVQRTGHPAYLVTVYEAGGNLFDHVRHHGALTPSAALGVFEQVLEALAVAHRRGVIHRDLKPQNIFLRAHVDRTEVPHVLVADFGIAKLQGFLGEHLTTAGMFVGTPEFAAPEQFKGLPPEPPSDVFAAACVFWFCLTGAPPVPLRDRTDLVASLRALREGLPPKLPANLTSPEEARRIEDLAAHTLIADPEKRWRIPTLLDALSELQSPASEPLDLGPMRTLAPDALFPLDEDVTPEPAPAVSEPEVAREPPPEPVPPVEPEPEPAPEPYARLRLGRSVETAPAPQPARPLPTDDGLDALFDSPAADDGVFHVGRSAEPEVSLDDLLAGPATPPPAPRRETPPPAARRATPPPAADRRAAPAYAPPVEASWETVAEGSPRAPSPPPEPEPDAPAWQPSSPAPVGAPASDADRLAALGRCALTEREALFAALEDPESAARAVSTGASADLICGAALVVERFRLERQATWARQLLTHADPDVRATAALALSAVGAVGQLALINRLLSDSDANVRLAAVHALRTLGERTGRRDMVQGWFAGCGSDPDPRVRAAARHR
ncbi:MAG: protein kinase [Myxococcales bacterium]|nr:protein kinase [Myxococcales bacterium]MCB9693150.1 protein kinase [Alphaproteobacteria bacterium]